MGGSTRRAAVDPGTVTGPYEGDPWRPTATVLSDLLGGEHRRPAARSGRLQLRPVCEVTEQWRTASQAAAALSTPRSDAEPEVADVDVSGEGSILPLARRPRQDVHTHPEVSLGPPPRSVSRPSDGQPRARQDGRPRQRANHHLGTHHTDIGGST
jgi:hypothetical protein